MVTFRINHTQLMTISKTARLNALLDTAFRTYLWNGAEKMLIAKWKESSVSMSENDFRTEAQLLAGFILDKNPEKLMLHNLAFNYLILPELQQWYASSFADSWTSGKLSRIALLLNHNLLTYISIESIGNLAAKMGYESIHHRFFSDETEGLKWLVHNGTH